MRSPRVGAEVTSDWLRMVVEAYEGKEHPDVAFSIESFLIEPATSPGENFSGELASVVVRGKLKYGENDNFDTKYNFMLKFESTEVFTKEVMRFGKNHLRELNLYEEIHKKIMELQERECGGKYSLCIPKLYYSYHKSEDYVLVIQDLRPLGFRTPQKHKGLGFQQLKLALNEIARWHALTHVYNRRYNLLTKYSYLLPVNNRTYELYINLIEHLLANIIPLARNLPEFRQDLVKKLSNPKTLMKKVRSLLYPKGISNPNKIFCLTHGDFWTNNLLFQYDKNTEDDEDPTKVSIIDWQTCYWNSPFLDLHHILYTSCSYDVRKAHLEGLLQGYYEVFEEITTLLQAPITGMTYESFKREFDDTALIGFMFGVTFPQVRLSKVGGNLNKPKDGLSSINVRSFSHTFKTKMARTVTPLSFNPSFASLNKAMIKTSLAAISEEITSGRNEDFNKLLSGLLLEASEKGFLDDVKSNAK